MREDGGRRMGCRRSDKRASAAVGATLFVVIAVAAVAAEGATWCIARSSASSAVLQAALDYACGGGADCTPIQPNGLCFLPNNLQAHASYAFNSYYQRRNSAAGSCDFAGTATTTITDPSFGSCTYPSSPSSAGGAATTTTTNATPGATSADPTTPTPRLGGGAGGGLKPGFGLATTDDSSTAVPPLAALLLPFSAAAFLLT